ncbi:hypothetical protein GM415_01200 [Pseudodesulfovibrio cashew]|uniref:Uncharacterized protein n=1 Tax=Pseudodesulfovibrio cashew TaxID=2678688 RepID=A0A6I6JCF2_9BACT|nr:hypothetical protein [Pseudodesulfovibrio cashew]QGY38809.1 hypothetical protein GM415_01200 [Pseudodesulfovibrio cashew]
MPKATAKDIREDIARARAYARKNDYLRTLSCLASALKNMLTSPVFGAEKFEIYAHLDEAMRDLNKMPMIEKLFPAGLKYQRGKEKDFYLTLMRLHKKLKEAMDKARTTKQRNRYQVLDDNLIKAGKLVQAGDQLEARKLYRKISEHFQDIEGIDSDIGNRMTQFGMFQEAVEYLTKALEISMSDIRAHNALIACYEGLGETEKGLDAIQNCMRYLGVSENLYVRAAKLHLAKRDWGEVYNNAKAALDRNPLNAEASKLLKQAEPRVMAGGSAKPSGGQAKKTHDLNF